MLLQQTVERLHEMKLTGMAQALEEQGGIPDIADLSFEDRLALLLEREHTARDILEHGLDQVGDHQMTLTLPAAHLNVRGAAYYSTHPEGMES